MLPSEVTDIIHSYATEKCYNCGDYISQFFLGLSPYLTMWYDNIRRCYIPNVFLCRDCKIYFKSMAVILYFKIQCIVGQRWLKTRILKTRSTIPTPPCENSL